MKVHVEVVVVFAAINFAIDFGDVFVSTAEVPLAVVQLEVVSPVPLFAFSQAEGVNVTYILLLFTPEDVPSRW